MTGKTISHYKILEKLGEGGMGVVYKAEDMSLRRTVALKFLAPQAFGEEDEKARFVHEAQAAAALSHPNICHVYEIDEFEGQAFIAVEYVDGRTLKDLMASGPMRLNDSLGICVQLAEGLREAHRLGIVHRDIKPANVMITPRGEAKIMDFGLAKSALRTVHTRTGTTIGTVAYMSPEQARGEDVDPRSDIWSLGVVLYEMISGVKPFEGDYDHAVVYSILNSEPEPITGVCPSVPSGVERVISRAMAKDPDERYRSMADMLSDLKSARKDLQAGASRQVAKKTRSGRRRGLAYGAAAALVIAIVAVLLIATRTDFFRDDAEAVDSIAVLPLDNLSEEPGQDFFAEGMTETLISGLAKIGTLKVISRTSVMRYKDSDKSLPDIARELGVDAVIEGSVQRIGDRVRITAQLVDGRTDRHLWAESYERDVRDVLALQSEVARAIAAEIKVKLTSQEAARLESARTVDPEAYESYLLGRYQWNRRTEEALGKSIEHFESAIARDPGYAMAYVGLAEAYAVMGDWGFMPAREAYPKARDIARRALAMDEDLAEAHTVLAYVKYIYDWDWEGAELGFKRALELNPSDATTRQWYAEFLNVTGRFDEAAVEIDRAVGLDPLSLIAQTIRGVILFNMDRREEALDQLQAVLDLDPDYWAALRHLTAYYFLEGMESQAVETMAKYLAASGATGDEIARMKEIYRTSGAAGVQRWAAGRLIEISSNRYVNPRLIAIWYALSGDDRAFEWLERAYEERAGALVWLMTDVRYSKLRSDPRFDALVEKIGLSY